MAVYASIQAVLIKQGNNQCQMKYIIWKIKTICLIMVIIQWIIS